MTKGDIRLHPEHGLNPTMPVCFWCGEETGEIALLGAAYKGEAPRRLCIGYEPCPDCQALMEQGCTVMEAGADRKPTGRWLVLKQEAADRIFPTAVGEARVLVESDVFARLQPKED